MFSFIQARRIGIVGILLILILIPNVSSLEIQQNLLWDLNYSVTKDWCSEVERIEVSDDGQTVAVGCDIGAHSSIGSIDRTGKILWTKISRSENDHGCLAYRYISLSGDGKNIGSISCDGNNRLIVFDNQGNLLFKAPWPPKGEIGMINGLKLSSDGESITYATNIRENNVGYQVRLFNKNGNQKWITNIGPYWPYVVSITPDGKYIAAGCHKDVIILLNDKGELLWTFKPDVTYEYDYFISTIAVSADGRYIIAGSFATGNTYCLDRSGKLLWQYNYAQPGDPGTLVNVDMSDDGTHFVVGSNNNIYLYDNTGKEKWVRDVITFRENYGRPPEINNIRISSNGQIIAVKSQQDVKIVNDKGELLWKYQPNKWPMKSPNGLDLSKDGKYLALSYGSSDVMKIEYFSVPQQSTEKSTSINNRNPPGGNIPNKSTPGFEFISAILGLLIIFLFKKD